MKLKEFDYKLPKNLIAQEPINPRDHSRLLILSKKTGRIEHRHFFNLPDYLKPGDVLVLNDTKVFPARLIGKKIESGGKIEIFLLKKISLNLWRCLAGGKRKKEGLEIVFSRKLSGELVKDNQDGTWNIKFNKLGKEFFKIIEKIGQVPLPPYIKRPEKITGVRDLKNYQTVYADERKANSVAAPTAGFHFTPALLKKIKDKGVKIEYITLHVGLGTFAPVKVENIKKHKMHSEWVEVKNSTLKRLKEAKKSGAKIIAVGTTSVRTLEAVWDNKEGFKGWVDIFIYPGYRYKAVDAMITNFHLPQSTLLMLVSAFAGKEKIDKAYEQAIKKKYRFFSYGDAMFIF